MMFLSFVATIEVIIMAFVKRIFMKTKQAEKSKAEKKGKKTSSKKEAKKKVKIASITSIIVNPG